MVSTKCILVIDDSPLFRRSVADFFEGRFTVLEAGTCLLGRKLIEDKPVDIAILDERLPDGSGLDLCQQLFQTHPLAKAIYATAFPSFDHAVKALQVGAHDYLSKPFEIEALGHAVDRLVSISSLERTSRLEAWRARSEESTTLPAGQSGQMQDVRRIIGLAAASDAAVIITGETGTGKNLVARAIHRASARSSEPFVSLNCSAIPEHLIEAELFGWTKGAFTGATASREGVLEMAEGGTLFLDEIGEMPMHLQTKLLSVLEDHEVMPLGGRVVRKIDVRVVAATNAHLEEAIEARRFRADLYYRLNVLRIELPPLKEHLDDIPELCLRLRSQILPCGSKEALPDAELERLMRYDWPGNVRELKNVLERALLLNTLPSAFLPDPRPAGPLPAPASTAADPLLSLEQVERRHVLRSLEMHAGNLTRCAEALGISLSTLKRKVKTYGLNHQGSF